MIDLKLLRTNFQFVKEKIKKKDPNFPVDDLFEKDQILLEKKRILEEKLSKINLISKNYSINPSDELKKESIKINSEVEFLKKEIELLEKNFLEIYLSCPNIPDDSLPTGDKDQNKVIKIFGEKKLFDFKPENHLDLLIRNKLIDFSKGTELAKSGFIFYSSEIANLIYRLCNIFIKHNESYGFKLVLPPYLISEETLKNAGNFPRFKDEVFTIEKDKLYLLPTSEVAIASLHQNETLDIKDLPLRYTSWTSCFRREAGGYGSHERGLIRIHQFEKVEIFSFTDKENSIKEHEYMLECVESLLKRFNLHYRISLLATQDCSFSSVKTYDIEIWLPGQNEYREVSSISLCTDFQSRRSKTKYKNEKTKDFVHTLNGSSLAVPRLIVALIENFQEKDSRINFKEILNLISSIEKSLFSDKIIK